MQQTMTYRRLLLFLQELDEEQLNCDLTIEDINEEFYPATISFCHKGDALHAGHPYFSIHYHNQ